MPNGALVRLKTQLAAEYFSHNQAIVHTTKSQESQHSVFLSLPHTNNPKHKHTSSCKIQSGRQDAQLSSMLAKPCRNSQFCQMSISREGERLRQGGGGDGRVEPTHLKERERGNDRLIYSKSEELVNQTLMVLGSESCSLSPFNLAPHTQSSLTRTLLHLLLSLSPSIPLSQKFSMVTHKHEPSLFLTDKSALIAAQHANQGALHAQRDKVNDRKIKRGRGGDLPSRVAAYVMPRQYLLR